MDYILGFAHPLILYTVIPCILVLAVLRWKFYKGVRYRYTLTSTMQVQGLVKRNVYKPVLFLVRLITLLLLVVLLAKPRFIDPRSHAKVEGIDMVLVLDVSGSMSYPHHGDD